MRFPTWNDFYGLFMYFILFRLKLYCLSRQVKIWCGCSETIGSRMSRNHDYADILITSLQATNLWLWLDILLSWGQSQENSLLFSSFILIFLFLLTVFPINFLYCCKFSTMITLLSKPRLSFPSPIKKRTNRKAAQCLKNLLLHLWPLAVRHLDAMFFRREYKSVCFSAIPLALPSFWINKKINSHTFLKLCLALN